MPMPDAKIHPTATAEAKKTVDAHQEPQDFVFYSGWFCPFVQRAWLALEEKGIDYEYREVNPYNKEQAFLEVSPKGLVPAATYYGKPMHESEVILEFIEDAYPDKKPNLRPTDPYEAAQMRIAVDHISKSIIPTYFKLLQAQEKDKQDSAREEIIKAFDAFGKKVKGPYWAGENVTFADLVLAPFAARMYILAEHRGLSDDLLSDNFKNWREAILQRDSVKKTLSDPQYYTEIYDRYLSNTAQSAMAQGTRGGTGEP